MNKIKKPLIDTAKIKNWYNARFRPDKDVHYLTYGDRLTIESVIKILKKRSQLTDLAEDVWHSACRNFINGISEGKLEDYGFWDKIEHSSQKMRKFVNLITKKYKENPEELRSYFNSDTEVLAGLASSAYFELTGNIFPIQSLRYGGLGCTINDCKKGLDFSRDQLNFAYIGKNALENAVITENALFLSSAHNEGLKSVKLQDTPFEKKDSTGQMYLRLLRDYKKGREIDQNKTKK